VKETAYNTAYNDDQMIIRYLLNDLPAEDEARFEEAYLRDGSLLEQVKAVEEELIDDYVKGGLSDYQRQRFELHYLASAPRRARVETARQLFDLCSSYLSPRVAVGEAPASDSFSPAKFLRSLMKQPLTLGFVAATALLLVSGAVLVNNLLRLQGELTAAGEERAALAQRSAEAERQLADVSGQLSAEQAQRVALNERLGGAESELDRLKQERDQPQTASDRIVFLALAPGSRDIKKQNKAFIYSRTDYLQLRVDLEGQEAGPYRVVLHAVDVDKNIWVEDGIKPRGVRSQQYLVIRVPADVFRAAKGQDFILTLSARVAGGNRYEEIENSYFQVISNQYSER
jgi:hypothetical protein